MNRLARHLEGRAGWRAPATALGLGALSALALPPLHALPLLWLAFPGWLILIGAAGSAGRAALLGWAFGTGHHLLGLYWITHSILIEAERYWWLVPIAVPALALALGAYAALPALAAWRARPGRPRVLALAGAWTAAELLRGWAFTGFPWNLLGSAWAFSGGSLQGVALVGAHGLSLLTVLLAAAPLAGRRGWGAAGAGLAALALLGLARLWPEEPPARPIALVLVQGNVAQEAKWREEQRWPIFRRYLELSREGLEAATREAPRARPVVVWPETASPFLLADDPEARRIAAAVLPPEGLLLAGTVRGEWGEDGRPRRLFNSLAAITPAGEVAALYDKHHLVPFGEYMPLSGLLPVRVVRGGADFSAGPGPASLALPGLPPVGPLICYEAIFPGAVVGPERPGWLLNVTNDAWFGVSTGPHQHLAAARMRAVEEGLPMVRAAQTGISAVFDSRGRTVARLGLAETGVVLAPLPEQGPPTPFARGGLPIPAALALMALIGAGLGTRGWGRAETKTPPARPFPENSRKS